MGHHDERTYNRSVYVRLTVSPGEDRSQLAIERPRHLSLRVLAGPLSPTVGGTPVLALTYVSGRCVYVSRRMCAQVTTLTSWWLGTRCVGPSYSAGGRDKSPPTSTSLSRCALVQLNSSSRSYWNGVRLPRSLISACTLAGRRLRFRRGCVLRKGVESKLPLLPLFYDVHGFTLPHANSLVSLLHSSRRHEPLSFRVCSVHRQLAAYKTSAIRG